MDPIKPQPTLKGYHAWVLQTLVLNWGLPQAEVAAWVIQNWIFENDEKLRKYGISFEAYQQETRTLEDLKKKHEPNRGDKPRSMPEIEG